MRILVIDDDPSIRELLGTFIGMIGDHQVDYAEDGQEGLSEITRLGPDLVFCDLIMPGMTGTEILRSVHANRDLSGTPFIMVSGLRFDPTFASIMTEHPNVRAFLAKPFDMEEIRAAVQRVANSFGDSGPAPKSALVRKPLAIVVIEDSLEMLQIINTVVHLEDAVHHTAKPKEALGLIKSVRPDLILLKMFTPQLFGVEIMRSLSTDAEFSRIPVMLMFGGSLAEEEVSVLKREFPNLWFVLTRPVTAETMRQTVEALSYRAADMA